ncbi:MAG: hypothetical protein ACYDHN_14575 [Solirubrobacteraceae bacterium]
MEELDEQSPVVERRETAGDWDRAFAAVVRELDARRARSERGEQVGADEPLRCVSSGYLEHGCSCEASVPRGAVTDAWIRELALHGSCEDRFFRFTWSGERWLAYGLGSGQVRGVYCPAHSAERDERASVTCSEHGEAPSEQPRVSIRAR